MENRYCHTKPIAPILCFAGSGVLTKHKHSFKNGHTDFLCAFLFSMVLTGKVKIFYDIKNPLQGISDCKLLLQMR